MRVMLLVLVALLIPAAAAAAPADVAGEAGRALNEQLERFNRTSEELYRHAENGRYEQALTAIQLLEKQATGMTFTGVTSLEGVEALYAAMLEVKRSLVSMAPDPQRISAQAARVRLAADALLRRPQPMWHQYYRGLRGDLDALQAANAEQQADAVRQAYAQFKARFAVVRPAIVISRDPSYGERYAAMLSSLDAAIRDSSVRFGEVEERLPALGALLDDTFEREHEDVFIPLPEHERPIVITLILGSIIIAVLAYAGWLKYRHDPGYRSASGSGPGRRP